MRREDFNIMANVNAIEKLKAELICVIGDLFKLLCKGSNIAQDAILNCISGAIIILYVLASRLGYSHLSVDECMKQKLKTGIIEGDEIEKDNKDLSKLYTHLKEREYGGRNGKKNME
ncbi:MazG-like family protein [Hathewaya limosa]|uniref:Stalled ribosome rescue protein Dom34 n=1 Tax=Hathewaya limosa TaxID=1536 RepID=A0ABU0JNS7_HATLI|nr:MazG-like family protein [Hathewaya limosa]AWZ49735.1 MazG-like family protein [Clostridiaceae bacterium 14S0207]MDQ0478725.1 stalled ribosome rescue protein Dom34 [Hathewaya limosa]